MIGTDPEFFILDDKGKPVPAWKFFPPQRQKILIGQAGALFRDGYALEVNATPESCRGRFGNEVKGSLKHALAMLPKDYSFTSSPAVRIDLNDMNDAPPDCQIFGCDESLNAYTQKSSSVNLDAYDHPFRYAGGHMHISSSNCRFLESDADKFLFVKLCDLFVGLPLAYLFDDEANVQRRKYYGRAGECRFQKYPDGTTGIEYRTPPPQLWNDQRLMGLMFGVFRDLSYRYKVLKTQWNPAWEPMIQDAINTGQVPYGLLQTAGGFYTPELLRLIKTERYFQDFQFIADPDDCHIGFGDWAMATYPYEWHKLQGREVGRYGPEPVNAPLRIGEPL